MIIVYDKFSTQDDLINDRTITCILKNVVSCIRTTALNGMYELEIQSVIDDDIINHIKDKTIIKSPSGQFYIVYLRQYSSETGLATIRCKHIFYYLTGRMCEESEKIGYNAYYAIASIMYEPEQDPRLIKYDFDYSSDISDLHDINYYGQNKAQALVGGSDSVCNIYKGELYRDNFIFSINKKMQHSKENAFVIRDHWNAKGITINIDDSETTTVLWGDDNLGNKFGVSRVIDGTFPYNTIKYQKYSYNQNSYLIEDSFDYYNAYNNPVVSVNVSLVSLRNTTKDSQWLELENYGVGDSGTVCFELLKFETTQRIIEQTYDELQQRTNSLKLGAYRNTILTKNKFDKLIAKDDSSGKRLDVIENALAGRT